MAEQARDYAHLNSSFEVVGGFLSPVGDAYKVIGPFRIFFRNHDNNSTVAESGSRQCATPHSHV
jgi:hypothetical protein